MVLYGYGHKDILQDMDRVEIALAPHLVHDASCHGDQRTRYHYLAHVVCRPRPRSPSPPPPPRKRACISAAASTDDAILGLTEVVAMSTMDDGCAICLKALAAGKVVHDDDDEEDDATDTDDDDDDDDATAADEKKATDNDDVTTWLRPLRLRAMPCSHVFHQHCIFKWLSRNRNAGCPLCRHNLPTTDDDPIDD